MAVVVEMAFPVAMYVPPEPLIAITALGLVAGFFALYFLLSWILTERKPKT